MSSKENRLTRKSILLKTADNKGMDLENIFDYFSDIKIVSNHDGYFYSVNEALKILLLGLLCGRKNIRERLRMGNCRHYKR